MNQKTLLLLLFVAAKIVLQYGVIRPEYDLHRDEYLHLDQAHHLAWGYLSVPPATSWISYLIFLLGNSEFWVKWFPALFGSGIIVVVWRLVGVLKGGLFAQILAATGILFSVLLRINTLYQPNSLDFLMWTLLFYTLVQYAATEKSAWLYGAALAFALGFLNKYNIVFAAAGLVPALLLTSQRRIFARKELYLAGALALALIAPNLFWQYQNGFPVIHHMQELAQNQLVNETAGDFLKEQFLFFLGSLFVLAAAMVSFFRYAPFRPYRFLFWAFWITLALFVFLKAKGYYSIGLYPTLLAFGAVYLEYLLCEGWKKKVLRPVAAALPAVIFLPFFWIIFPNLSPEEIHRQSDRYRELGLLRWEDGQEHYLPQDFADMLGWKELAQKVDQALATIPEPQHTLLFCDNYGQAGACNFYSKNKTVRAVSFNADYINWIDLDRDIRHVVLVKEANDDDPDRTEESPLFDSVVRYDSIENPYAREVGTRIYILREAKTNIAELLRKEMEEQ